jgi:catechol 2,3-dioxygenase-like lactoylglutathione lyase family enzyme
MRQPVEIALFTDDVAAVRGFYELLLAGAPEAEWPGGALFDAGGVKVLIHERGEAPAGGPANEDHLAVGAPDVDRACDELRAEGLELLVEPRDYPWGRSAYLRDPDGRMVELTQA